MASPFFLTIFFVLPPALLIYYPYSTNAKGFVTHCKEIILRNITKSLSSSIYVLLNAGALEV